MCACLRVTLPSAIVPASPPSCASQLASAVNVYPTPLLQCPPSSPAPVDIHRPTCTAAAVCSVPALEPLQSPAPTSEALITRAGGRATRCDLEEKKSPDVPDPPRERHRPTTTSISVCLQCRVCLRRVSSSFPGYLPRPSVDTDESTRRASQREQKPGRARVGS